jgi:hypothetical protein
LQGTLNLLVYNLERKIEFPKGPVTVPTGGAFSYWEPPRVMVAKGREQTFSRTMYLRGLKNVGDRNVALRRSRVIHFRHLIFGGNH